jgi:hypothetical protein
MHDPSASQSLPHLGCLWGTLPDPLNPLVVDRPARLTQQSCDLAIAVAADVGGEPLLIVTATRHLALGRAVLPERHTGAALGDMQLGTDLLNAGSAARGAQKFPRAAS